MSIRMSFPPLSGEVAYEWHFKCNGTGATWRERLAYALRLLASRLDGRLSLAITMHSTPVLPREEHIACVKQGMKAMERALNESVRTAAEEALIRRERPELYMAEGTGR